MRTNKNRFKILLPLAIVLLFVYSVYSGIYTAPFAQINYAENLVVHYMDVGQGDCEILMLPNGVNILIDGGPGAHEDRLVAEITELGIDRFDYVLATHPHEDHIGGLDKVIQTFGADCVYMPYVSASTAAFENFAKAVKDSGATVYKAKSGVVMLDLGDIKAELLAPCSESYEDLNNYSAVLKFTYKETDFLFTGDAEEYSEEEMLLAGSDLSADVLKVGHHGSSTSTSARFLDAVNPSVAVIEVGEDNSYGHPSAKVLKRLGSARVYRTDIDGGVAVECDGKGFKVHTER